MNMHYKSFNCNSTAVNTSTTSRIFWLDHAHGNQAWPRPLHQYPPITARLRNAYNTLINTASAPTLFTHLLSPSKQRMLSLYIFKWAQSTQLYPTPCHPDCKHSISYCEVITRPSLYYIHSVKNKVKSLMPGMRANRIHKHLIWSTLRWR